MNYYQGAVSPTRFTRTFPEPGMPYASQTGASAHTNYRFGLMAAGCLAASFLAAFWLLGACDDTTGTGSTLTSSTSNTSSEPGGIPGGGPASGTDYDYIYQGIRFPNWK